MYFFFSSRRRHTRFDCDWSSDVCSSDLRISATVPSDVIEVERDELLKLIQTDTELSDIFLRAFILRRLQLIDRGYGDVVVLGSEHCTGTLHIREFLTRNGHPYTQRDLDTDAESQELLDRFHLTADDVPVVICRGKTVLKKIGRAH